MLDKAHTIICIIAVVIMSAPVDVLVRVAAFLVVVVTHSLWLVIDAQVAPYRNRGV